METDRYQERPTEPPYSMKVKTITIIVHVQMGSAVRIALDLFNTQKKSKSLNTNGVKIAQRFNPDKTISLP